MVRRLLRVCSKFVLRDLIKKLQLYFEGRNIIHLETRFPEGKVDYKKIGSVERSFLLQASTIRSNTIIYLC